MFKNAIVRKPCPEMTHGLSSASFGEPDYDKAESIEAPRTLAKIEEAGNWTED